MAGEKTRPANYPALKNYKPTRFMLQESHYDSSKADRAVRFIENLCHTKGRWSGKPFWLLPWQEQIIRDVFGIVKEDGTRQFRTAYVEIPKKQRWHCTSYMRMMNRPQRCTGLQQTGSRLPSYSMWPNAWWK